ncbi:hypothetical protein ABW19_dt0209594 [Dactylella cylindrospora]|nr:hypothetical protein ABW19_dt0209594 [Dactylella cylindrospora]
MPAYSTLNALLGLALAIHRAQATVVIPFETYVGYGPIGVPNEYVRFPEPQRNGTDYFQGRVGVHFELGTPPQHIWIAPHFYNDTTFVNDVKLCEPNPEYSQAYCEDLFGSLFASNESSTWQPARGPSGTDVAYLTNSYPDLRSDMFPFSIINGTDLDYSFQDFGILGLGPGSTFIETFFPGKPQIGLYYPGNSTTPKLPASAPPRPFIPYEMEFDGYNETHFTGEKYTQPIGPPLEISNTTNPFWLNVTGLTLSGVDLLQGESFLATIDLLGRSSDAFPGPVYDRFGELTGAINPDHGWYHRYNTTLPTDPNEWFNLTITFSNGYSVTKPQNFLLASFDGEFASVSGDTAMSTIMNADGTQGVPPWPIRGPLISVSTLLLSSYVGVDWATEEWFIAKAVHPWDEQGSEEPDGDDSSPNAAGGMGSNLNRMVLLYVAGFAAAFVLLG